MTIIGVIAALTIPNLIAKYEKEQTVVGVKKVYNQLYQAYILAKTDYGESDTWDVSSMTDISTTSTEEYYNKYLKPYLKVAKYCGNANGCWANSTKFLNGQDGNNNATTYLPISTKLVLADGTNLALIFRKGGSDSSALSILADINGNKGPNIIGKDIFSFFIVNKFRNNVYINLGVGDIILTQNLTSGLFADGYGKSRKNLLESAYRGCNKTSSVAGYHCSALIQLDGWQIKDDYPW